MEQLAEKPNPNRCGLASPLGVLRFVVGDLTGKGVGRNEKGGLRVENRNGRPVPDWLKDDLKANGRLVAETTARESTEGGVPRFYDSAVAGYLDRILVSVETFKQDEPVVEAARETILGLYESVEGEFGSPNDPKAWPGIIVRERILERASGVYQEAFEVGRFLVGEELRAAAAETFGVPNDSEPEQKREVDLSAFDSPLEPIQEGAGYMPEVGSRWVKVDGEGKGTEAVVTDRRGRTVVYDWRKTKGAALAVETFRKEFRAKDQPTKAETDPQGGLFDDLTETSKKGSDPRENQSSAKPGAIFEDALAPAIDLEALK